jgi:hypothetical protein
MTRRKDVPGARGGARSHPPPRIKSRDCPKKQPEREALENSGNAMHGNAQVQPEPGGSIEVIGGWEEGSHVGVGVHSPQKNSKWWTRRKVIYMNKKTGKKDKEWALQGGKG